MACILPPPRWRKMSGAEPELRAFCSLPSRSSFCTVWILIVTSGCSLRYSFAAFCQNTRPRPSIAFVQTVTVASPPTAPSSSPPPAHPAAASARQHRPIAAAVALRVFLVIGRS